MMDLRQAIFQKLQNKNQSELHDIINDSVNNDERTLPGLGVIFELIWEKSDEQTQNHLVSTLENHIPH
ncbi:small acid-soluble spore protein SspI [Chengkuizengella axinellae]|uniref:Small, acid-soluble spore protein I n=1 Tax=Chengkuizengella axinellae TaxID=3064388 RepID=A0ABT9IUL4_9BACL|nr:small acid-soluble spore protein SspI [Chengkuizengella sp. 2205SS18-9]MDP5272520.1 small acid-soluble spore protein SspI [Chengkuizengella sp. 2205SS18-9]